MNPVRPRSHCFFEHPPGLLRIPEMVGKYASGGPSGRDRLLQNTPASSPASNTGRSVRNVSTKDARRAGVSIIG